MTGQQLREVMEEARMSPGAFADALMVSITTLYRLFRDEPKVHLNTWARVGEKAAAIRSRIKASA